MSNRFLPAMMAVLAIIGAAQCASARHHHSSSEAAPGEFDYYLLALSWSPAYCLQSPGAPECNGPRRFGFIVHGLWPQNETGWPEKCATDAQVPDSVVQGMSDLMPARELVLHEWSAHGTCSGLNPEDFFALVRRAYRGIRIPASLATPTTAATPNAPAPSIEQSPAAVVNAFKQANPRLPPQSVLATCSGQGMPRLREVWVCFERDLTPRPCSADTMRGACRALSVIVPPIR